MSEGCAALAREVGILPDYKDTTGSRHETGADTRAALLAAMGLPAEPAAAADMAREMAASREARPLPDWRILPPERAARLPTGRARLVWRLVLEDGSELDGRCDGEGVLDLPALPLGRHRLEADGFTTHLLAAPPRLSLPERSWGVTLPLYGLRPPGTPGLASYGDLADAARAVSLHGAEFLGINPVHAGFPADPGAISPYSPSHRRRLNAMHVDAGTEPPASSGDLVDYPEAIAARRAAQRTAFAGAEACGRDPDFAAYLAEGGDALRAFAIHQALSDRHGAYWPSWPAALQDPASDAVAGAAAEDEIALHGWLQWQAEAQMRAAASAAAQAGMRHGLYLDLAVGTHPAGAETWGERHRFAAGASLGAPPDSFSPDGQTWGLAPFNPLTLRREGFAALAETLAAQLRFAKLLRIDHILGFDRAFWVPAEAGLPGAYVAMPREAMLAVARIEAARAGAVLVGEDLGNIPEGLRESLEASGILGCRVAMFETETGAGGAPRLRPPSSYPKGSLASFGTHDLPTWAGWRRGADIALRQRLGGLDAAAADQARQERQALVAGVDAALPSAPEPETPAGAAERSGAGSEGGRRHLADPPPVPTGDADSPDRIHTHLARSGSALVALQIEDILNVEEQANLPGTIDEYPNWRRRLPVPTEALGRDPRLARAAEIMAREDR